MRNMKFNNIVMQVIFSRVKRDRIGLVVFVETPRRHLVCKAKSYNARFWGLNWIKQTERRGCIVTVQNVFLHD